MRLSTPSPATDPSRTCHTHQHDLTTLLGSKNGQLRTGYDRSTIVKINFDGIDFKKHLLDPRPGSVHPALQY
jgi:hypothetical protein